jgi:hypothetical protein
MTLSIMALRIMDSATAFNRIAQSVVKMNAVVPSFMAPFRNLILNKMKMKP